MPRSLFSMNSMISVISVLGGNSLRIAYGLAGVVFRTINEAKCFLDPFHALGRIILALQTDEVDSANFGRIAIGDHKRRNVLDDFRAAAGNGEAPDPAKLINGSQSANDRVVADFDMPCQCSVVRKDNFIANFAVVSDVAVGEKRSTVADLCFSFARRAAADGNEFAKRIFIADLQIRRFTRILEILRLLPNRAGSVKFISRAGAHRS